MKSRKNRQLLYYKKYSVNGGVRLSNIIVSRALILIVVSLLLLITGFQFIPPEKAIAATGVVRPDGDVTRQWTSLTDGNAGDGETCDATHHWYCINESTYTGTDYINTNTTLGDGIIERYTMGEVAGSSLPVSGVAVKVYAWSNGCQSTCDTLTINISIDGATQTGQTMTMTATADTNQTFTFNGSWTGDNDLEVIITRNVLGSGPAGNRDDDVRLAYIDSTVTFTPDIRQSHYRWRNDTAALNTNSGWLANEDTAPPSTDVRINSTLRLRVEIEHNGTGGVQNVGYRLQWAAKAASCSAATGWTRIDTGSDAWEMVASSQYADGDSLSSSFLTAGEATFVNGYGLEFSGDDQTAAVQLDPDDYTEIEWAIKPNSNAVPGASYCFRVVDDSGAVINGYDVYPEAMINSPTGSKLSMTGYIFENEDGANADSNSQAEAGNTGLASVRRGERLNLRTQLKNTGDSSTANSKFALFYDRGDGFWTKVTNDSPDYGPSGSEDCAGFDDSGGSTDFACTTIIDGNSAGDAADYNKQSSLAFNPVTGTPYIVSYDYNVSLNTAGNNLVIAEYVGSGGNCDGFDDTGGSDAWQCTIIIDGNSLNDYLFHASLAFSPTGTPYVVSTNYSVAQNTTGNNLIVASYRGTPGGNCDGFDDTGGSDFWDCTTIIDGNSTGGTGDYIAHSSIAFSPNGVLYVAATNDDVAMNTTGNNLIVASYRGSAGGNCDGFDDTGGSDLWDCTTVIDGDNITDFFSYSSIDFSASGVPYIVATNYNENLNTTGSNLVIAQFVGSGGNCDGFDEAGGSDSWECTTLIDGDDTFDYRYYNSLVVSPSGTPYIIATNYNESLNTAGNNVVLLSYRGTAGGNCDGFDDTGGSDLWDCTTVIDGDNASDYFYHGSLRFSPSGNPFFVTNNYNESLNTAGNILMYAQYVGSGGNCDGFDDPGGSDAWSCGNIIDGNNTVDYMEHASLAFSPSGTPYISTTNDSVSLNTSGNNLSLVAIKRRAEITLSPSLIPSGSAISETHVDMTNVTDDTNRNDNDCVGGGNPNNGITSVAEEFSLTIPAGDSTPQCTEISFTIDTSQATEGTTYRFVIATDESFDSISGRWRGPISVSGYPSITVETDTDIRYSKDAMLDLGSCTGFEDTGGDSNWGCSTILDGNNISDYSNQKSIAFSPAGIPYVASYNFNVALNTTGSNLVIANYVGSGGNCDGFDDTGGSDAWQCTTVIDGNDASDFTSWTSMAFSPSGVPYIITTSSNEGPNTTGNNLIEAHYVGSGGNCDGFVDSGGSDAWQCTNVIDGNDTTGDFSFTQVLTFTPSGTPYLATTNYNAAINTTGNLLLVASYVGSGGNCDGFVDSGGSDAWQCTNVMDGNDTSDFNRIDMAISPNGIPYVVTRDFNVALNTTGSNLVVASYIGSGGNCDGFTDTGGSDAWQCTNIIDGNTTSDYNAFSKISFSNTGLPYVVSVDNQVTQNTTGNNLVVANYVGSGGNCDGFDDIGGSDAWDCTTILDGDDSTGGNNEYSALTMAISPSGTPYVVVRNPAEALNTTGSNLVVANYVGSGGNCDGFDDIGGSDAWQCTNVIDGNDSNDFDFSAPIAFSASGVPYIVVRTSGVALNTNGTNLVLAALQLPAGPLGNNMGGRFIDSGDLRFRLSDGRSPRSNYNGTCGSGTASYMGYCGAFESQGDYDSVMVAAGEKAMYTGAVKFNTNTQLPKLNWKGRSTLAPNTASTAGDIVLQVYRFGSTNAWETITSDTASSNCNTADCTLSGSPTGTVSEYFQTSGSEYWIYFRVYQRGTNSSFTFSVDQLSAVITGQRLRGGKVFEGGVAKPLNTD